MKEYTSYSQELAEEICDKLSIENKSLTKLQKENPHWPDVRTIHNWRVRNKEFAEMFTRARCNQVEVMIDEIKDDLQDNSKDYYIDESGRLKVDHENVHRARLRIDTAKWLAGKLLPRMYGEKISNQVEIKMTHEEALKKLEELE